MSGTLGLSGAADTTVILHRDGTGATLYSRGRDVEEIEAAIEFDREACRWRILGAADEVRRSDERGTVLALLKEADAAMTPAELAALTDSSGGAMRKLLHVMAKAGEVSKVGTGRYIHPARTDLAMAGNAHTPGNTGNSGNTYRYARDGEPSG